MITQSTTDGDDRIARAAMRAGALAYFVDQFDIYLPIITLAPAAAYFQSAGLDTGTAAILDALVFASTLLARPVGAAIFGHYADRTGRKNCTLVAIAGFGVTTLLIALLPGYQTIGMWSVGLLIALRFVDGIFLGGEYTASVPLSLEWSPVRKRGLYSGIITATSPAAYALIAVLTLVLLTVLPSAGVESAYSQWGWRIPFVIGAMLALVLFVAYRRGVQESLRQEGAAPARSPLRELLGGVHRRALAQVFVLMSGIWLANNMANAVMPGLLHSHLGLTSTQVTIAMIVATVATAIALPMLGHLSQVIGRRRYYIGCGLVVLVACSVAYATLMGTELPLGLTVLLTAVVEVLAIAPFAPIAAYLNERFPSAVRASGYGVGYSLALIVPAFYAFYIGGLARSMPAYYAPVVLVALAGLLIGIGGAVGPETRHVRLREPEPATDSQAAARAE